MRFLSSLLCTLLVILCSCNGSANGQRRVGIDASWYPLQLGNQEHNVTAFSTELLTDIGEVEKIPFVKVTVNWDDLMEGLQKDKYEAILSSMPPYIFNEKLFDYSDVYLPMGPVLIVPIGSPIHALDMLSEKEIAIISGSTHGLLLEGIPGVLIRDYDAAPKALNDVLDGTVDGVILGSLPAVAYCRDLYQGKLKIATPPLTAEGLRLVTKHDAAPSLVKGFNAGLKKLKENGTYHKLLDKWNLAETNTR